MDKKILNINDLINGEIIIQVGVDKNDNPIYVGDTIIEELSYDFSTDYWNGFDERARNVYGNEVKTIHCNGKVYRKVIFNGFAFQLDRIKTEGYLPKGEAGSEWAIQSNLIRYEKLV